MVKSEKQSENETNTHGTKEEDGRKGKDRLREGERKEVMLNNRTYKFIEKGRQQGSYFFPFKSEVQENQQ